MADLRLGDCLQVLPTLAAESVDLVFADPPYNIGKASWDRIGGYMEWCAEWIAECSRVLKPNGAFWISHSKPLVLAELSGLVAGQGRGLVNWITWDKSNWSYVDKLYKIAGSRSFIDANEYLIYHADEGDWASQCDRERGFIFEPLRAYLVDEIERAGVHKEDINEWLGFRRQGGMAGRHYFSKSQWCLPTEEHYHKMRECLHSLNGGGEYLKRDYEDLKRDYEDLRAEFEDLRYTFNNPGKMSSVWQIPPARANGHETPKPEELLRRIVLAASNEGDLVLDPFMGSGTTAVVCEETGRNFIGIEIEPKYMEIAKNRLAQRVLI